MASEPYDTDRVLTVPNALSALRLVGVPVFLWLLLGPRNDLAAIGILACSGLTDWLDGFIARRWHQRSRLGQVLDPIADRLYIVAIILGLAIRDFVPWWLVAVLLARDLMLLALVPMLRSRGSSSLPVHFIGKAATFCLLYAFPLILLGGLPGDVGVVAKVVGWAFAIWGAGLYWWAGLLYVRQTMVFVGSTRTDSSDSGAGDRPLRTVDTILEGVRDMERAPEGRRT